MLQHWPFLVHKPVISVPCFSCRKKLVSRTGTLAANDTRGLYAMKKNKNRKSLSFILGATAVLVLSGCATTEYHPLPVDKVVLDWKDFYPTTFEGVGENCNTFVYGLYGSEYQKRLCLVDSNSPIDDRYGLFVGITKYETHSPVWKNINDKSPAQTRSSTLFQLSKKTCANNYQPIGNQGFRCTPEKPANSKDKDMDILVAYSNLVSSSGLLIEASILHAIDPEKTITEDSWQYQTAMKIISQESLEEFL